VPIYDLLNGQGFDPELCDGMGVAYERILKELGLKSRVDPMCELVAARVIEVARRGVREPEKLYELAMALVRL